MSGKYRYFRACPGPSVLGRGGLKPGWYHYLFDFIRVFAARVRELEASLPIGFGCTIMISNGTRLPCTGGREALP